MLRQHIQIGNDDWDIYVYYCPEEPNFSELAEVLFNLGCPQIDIIESLDVVFNQYNTGMTFTSTIEKTSVVCIGKATSKEQFVNTVVHEAKHVQSHICSHYLVDEDEEQAAYLIGHLVQRMYRYVNGHGGF